MVNSGSPEMVLFAYISLALGGVMVIGGCIYLIVWAFCKKCLPCEKKGKSKPKSHIVGHAKYMDKTLSGTGTADATRDIDSESLSFEGHTYLPQDIEHKKKKHDTKVNIENEQHQKVTDRIPDKNTSTRNTGKRHTLLAAGAGATAAAIVGGVTTVLISENNADENDQVSHRNSNGFHNIDTNSQSSLLNYQENTSPNAPDIHESTLLGTNVRRDSANGEVLREEEYIDNPSFHQDNFETEPERGTYEKVHNINHESNSMADETSHRISLDSARQETGSDNNIEELSLSRRPSLESDFNEDLQSTNIQPVPLVSLHDDNNETDSPDVQSLDNRRYSPSGESYEQKWPDDNAENSGNNLLHTRRLSSERDIQNSDTHSDGSIEENEAMPQGLADSPVQFEGDDNNIQTFDREIDNTSISQLDQHSLHHENHEVEEIESDHGSLVNIRSEQRASSGDEDFVINDAALNETNPNDDVEIEHQSFLNRSEDTPIRDSMEAQTESSHPGEEFDNVQVVNHVDDIGVYNQPDNDDRLLQQLDEIDAKDSLTGSTRIDEVDTTDSEIIKADPTQVEIYSDTDENLSDSGETDAVLALGMSGAAIGKNKINKKSKSRISFFGNSSTKANDKHANIELSDIAHTELQPHRESKKEKKQREAEESRIKKEREKSEKENKKQEKQLKRKSTKKKDEQVIVNMSGEEDKNEILIKNEEASINKREANKANARDTEEELSNMERPKINPTESLNENYLDTNIVEEAAIPIIASSKGSKKKEKSKKKKENVSKKKKIQVDDHPIEENVNEISKRDSKKEKRTSWFGFGKSKSKDKNEDEDEKPTILKGAAPVAGTVAVGAITAAVVASTSQSEDEEGQNTGNSQREKEMYTEGQNDIVSRNDEPDHIENKNITSLTVPDDGDSDSLLIADSPGPQARSSPILYQIDEDQDSSFGAIGGIPDKKVTIAKDDEGYQTHDQDADSSARTVHFDEDMKGEDYALIEDDDTEDPTESELDSKNLNTIDNDEVANIRGSRDNLYTRPTIEQGYMEESENDEAEITSNDRFQEQIPTAHEEVMLNSSTSLGNVSEDIEELDQVSNTFSDIHSNRKSTEAEWEDATMGSQVSSEKTEQSFLAVEPSGSEVNLGQEIKEPFKALDFQQFKHQSDSDEESVPISKAILADIRGKRNFKVPQPIIVQDDKTEASEPNLLDELQTVLKSKKRNDRESGEIEYDVTDERYTGGGLKPNEHLMEEYDISEFNVRARTTIFEKITEKTGEKVVPSFGTNLATQSYLRATAPSSIIVSSNGMVKSNVTQNTPSSDREENNSDEEVDHITYSHTPDRESPLADNIKTYHTSDDSYDEPIDALIPANDRSTPGSSRRSFPDDNAEVQTYETDGESLGTPVEQQSIRSSLQSAPLPSLQDQVTNEETTQTNGAVSDNEEDVRQSDSDEQEPTTTHLTIEDVSEIRLTKPVELNRMKMHDNFGDNVDISMVF